MKYINTLNKDQIIDLVKSSGVFCYENGKDTNTEVYRNRDMITLSTIYKPTRYPEDNVAQFIDINDFEIFGKNEAINKKYARLMSKLFGSEYVREYHDYKMVKLQNDLNNIF